MKYLLLLVVIAVSAPSICAEEKKNPIAGLWQGSIQVGATPLKLVFQIDAGKEGKLRAKMISLDQGDAVVPCKTVEFSEKKLVIELPDVGAKYVGTYDEKVMSFSGTFTQGTMKFELTLKPIEKLPTKKRPQVPMKPYPYIEEEMIFTNPKGDFQLAGTLTKPKGDGPFPAVVLVSGSGPQDRDESLFGHKPFLILADHLTRAGFAVLRYDDRGVGESKGKFAGANTHDFADDAFAAVQFLRSRKEITGTKIGIIGHSEGGLVAPIVAATHPKEIAFIVLLAGPGLRGDVILSTQTQDILESEKTKPEEIAVAMKLQNEALKMAISKKDTKELREALPEFVKTFLKALTEEERKHFEEVTPEAIATKLEALLDPWMRHFLKHDPAPVLKQVKCPVLALFGERDVQVSAKPNAEAVRAALKLGKNERSQVTILSGLNHLFQKCQTAKLSEYGELEETMNPAALKAISEWLLKQTRPVSK